MKEEELWGDDRTFCLTDLEKIQRLLGSAEEEPSNNRFSSNAKWTKIPDSKDIHEKRDFAESICNALINNYGEHTDGCETRGYCLETWIEEEREG